MFLSVADAEYSERVVFSRTKTQLMVIRVQSKSPGS